MYSRVVKSSRLPLKIASYLVGIGRLLFLAFLYGWCFLNKISLDWPFTLTSQPSTSKLSDIPVYSLFNKGSFGHWELGIGKPLFSSRSSKSFALSAVCTNAQMPLYGWCFLNKISLDWPFTLTTQPSTSKLSDIPVYSLFNKGFFGHWELGIGKPLFSSRSSKSCALSAVCTNAQWPITNSQRVLKQPLLNQLYVVWSVTNTGSNLG